MLKAAVVGKDGRTSAIEKSLEASPLVAGPVVCLSAWKDLAPDDAMQQALENAAKERPDFVVIGPEEPLESGLVDRLQGDLGIPCIGPTKELARLESSKVFTRQLLADFGIPGNPEFRVFRSLKGIAEYLERLPGYVVKPDGLTGGKGVRVSDVHLFSTAEAVDYCQELFLRGDKAVIIEEKLDGEEFSLMSFCDGTSVSDMVVVQDHKRVGENDSGPNTGGMGSYSCADGRLPFLSEADVKQASAINAAVAKALLARTGQKYKGILYGGFMLTASGLRLLEYNARFGDPETMNVLSVLKTDFALICQAIINETLHQLPIEFSPLATVCKYVVPDGYPDKPVKNECIDLSGARALESESLKIFLAALERRDGREYLTGSRAVAFVGIGKTLAEAETIAEQAASLVRGPVYHRRDIGTEELIQRRIAHVQALREEQAVHIIGK